MSFLVFTHPSNSKTNAEAGIAAVNDMYGCPLIFKNGYRMETWDVPIQSNDGTQWGFHTPKTMLGKGKGQLMGVIAGGFSEYGGMPASFIPDDDEV